ncbi:MAG: LuxR C-terminal-related transcriptional regulator [Candidatus Dormibacteria bacterium]
MPIDVEGQVSAGYQAMSAADWPAGRQAFAAVLEVAEIPEALMGLANACYWLGDLAGVLDAFERAYAAARRRSDPVLAAYAALSLVGYQKQFQGNVAAARGWVSRAARIIEAEAPQLRGALLGATAYVTDEPVESERLAREALEIGRADGDPDLELLAMTALGGALVQQGRIAEGMSLLDEAMAGALAGVCGDPLTVAHTSCMTMLVCASHFDIARATQWLQAMERFIDRYGCPFLNAECRTNYGRVLFENGDWDAAERFLIEAISMSKGVIPASHALASGTLGELRLAQGRTQDSAGVLEGLEGRDEAVAAVATLYLARDEPWLAATVLRRRLDGVGSVRLDVAGLIELLGRAEIAMGSVEPARARARSLIELGAAGDCHLIVAHGHRLLGQALVSSNPTASCSHFEWALAAFLQAEIPYRAAQTRLLLAGLLRETDPVVAAAEARTALTVFEDLGAGRDADAAAALLRGLGVKAARAGPKNVGRLTRREHEVLRLLGEGLSNPEIAERLFLSRKTVEHHVAHVLSKLGIRGRAEAAAIAARLEA